MPCSTAPSAADPVPARSGFAGLDAEANAMSDAESARLVDRERDSLFRSFPAWPSAA